MIHNTCTCLLDCQTANEIIFWTMLCLDCFLKLFKIKQILNKLFSIFNALNITFYKTVKSYNVQIQDDKELRYRLIFLVLTKADHIE